MKVMMEGTEKEMINFFKGIGIKLEDVGLGEKTNNKSAENIVSQKSPIKNISKADFDTTIEFLRANGLI